MKFGVGVAGGWMVVGWTIRGLGLVGNGVASCWKVVGWSIGCWLMVGVGVAGGWKVEGWAGGGWSLLVVGVAGGLMGAGWMIGGLLGVWLSCCSGRMRLWGGSVSSLLMESVDASERRPLSAAMESSIF